MHFLSIVAFSALLAAVPSAIGTPVASPALIDNLTSGNAYSGTGGTAVGGSVNNTSNGTGLLDTITGGKSLLSLGSENAGNGGNASSGSATTRGGGRGRGGRGGRRRPGLGGILGPGGILGSLPIAGLNLDSITSTRNQNNAYSGAGGNASGGDVNSPGSLIDLFSREYSFLRLLGSALNALLRQRWQCGHSQQRSKSRYPPVGHVQKSNREARRRAHRLRA